LYCANSNAPTGLFAHAVKKVARSSPASAPILYSGCMDKLLQRIAAKRDDAVALTQALVRIPTVNPPGDVYTDCAQYLGQRLRQHAFQVEYVRAEGVRGDTPQHPRTNVIGRIEGRGTGSGECVHFNSHIDVVEPGSGWTFDPFAATIANNRIYGRGTCDMKGGLAASVIAIEAILEAGIVFNGALEISGTVDEESGGYGGVGYLAERGYFSRPRVHHVIIPEPLNVDRICVGHRGVWWAEVETKGRIAHGSMPFLGDSAINHMGAFLAKLEAELLPKISQRTTAQPVEPKLARRSTLNVNSIHGGQAEDHGGYPSPVVAHSCRAVLDRRFLVEEELADVKDEIIALLDQLKVVRPGFDYVIRDVMEFLPTFTPLDAPVVTATRDAIRRVLGKEPDFIASPGTYDQKHIYRTGKLDQCIAYGPGILDLAHQPDEYVDIDDLMHSAQVMALSALRLLRVDGF
jgi:succinyl-diaminopimelate desuccinylase